MNKINKIIIPILLFASCNMGLFAQPAQQDSLTLSAILNTVMQTYPALKKTDNDLQAADAKISLTKTAYLPDVNVSASYSHLGPVSKITMPGVGTFQLYPADNYSATVNVSENIYDFGRTTKTLLLDQKNKDMILLASEQVKQRLSALVMNFFYNIGFIQEAIKIKDEQLTMLNEHLNFVQKKAATGSATQYEILATRVKISGVENQKTDLLTALEVQTEQLNTYLGNPAGTYFTVKTDVLASQILAPRETLIDEAYTNRIEMKLSKQKEEISKSKLDLIGVQNNPSVNLFGSGGIKNGYIPNLANPKANYVAGVNVKIPLFDANRSKYTKMQVKAEMANNEQDTELARKSIINEVTESRANAEAALKKVRQSELQLQQAQEANKMAEISYKAGSITNLDLMDSYTAVSESKLAVYKTRLDYTMNMAKLTLALGKKLY